MDAPRVLIIEDEPKVAGFIKEGLETSGFEIDIAYDGLIGERMALTNKYDCIILDVNVPHKNGFEICKEIRNHNAKIQILMLTALGATDDKLNGFNMGADDYLVKPFEFRELLARLRVLLKRSQTNIAPSNIIRVADLEMNIDTKSVKRGDVEIELTPKEFKLLEFLMLNKKRVISKVELADKVWSNMFNTGTNVIEVYVNFLRKKIDRDFSHKLIHTHVGMGYVLKE
jgi:two-component system copper resistance phosphate regulon response regulator CusR